MFERNLSAFIEDWFAFLRFPSVGTDPAHAADCRSCAEWLCCLISESGFNARVLETGSIPAVYAERRGGSGRPTVLFYGHYDVQPVDPLPEWKSPPFEPELRGGRVYARGASDNKGQVMSALKAMEQLVRLDALDATVRILIEGEEESGSGGVARNLAAWSDLLRADVLMVCDTGMAPGGAPALTIGLRGLVHATVEIGGPSRDLHSGVHGGVAPNPAAGIARLVAGLHDDCGRIAVDGFCDGIEPPTQRERELAGLKTFDERAYRNDAGVPPVAGDLRFTPVERLAFQPSIDVNGLRSGYDGSGTKTIIPSRARAKLTCRLAAGQDPERCLALLKRHLESHAPPGLELRITESGVAGPGFRLDPDSATARKAMAVLDAISDKPAEMIWEGASIPIVSGLARISGAEPLLAGFASPVDSIHAPNESFSLEQFRMGFEYAARLLASF
jgi:acetylornithine deacetylase/succinyl-diaminopimelate desuccinylase-like protein